MRDDPVKEEIKQKMEDYATFVGSVLRPDLLRCQARQETVQSEIDEYEELLCKLAELKGKTSYENTVDLAHEAVFCRAVADSVDRIYIHIGMGFHAELTVSEAEIFTKKRITFLTTVC